MSINKTVPIQTVCETYHKEGVAYLLEGKYRDFYIENYIYKYLRDEYHQEPPYNSYLLRHRYYTLGVGYWLDGEDDSFEYLQIT